jgi:F-type H+-transporting ATPase subunit delta
MAGQSKIGVRYAQALFTLASERKETDKVYADMKAFSSAFDGSEELRIMLKSPVIKADKKVSVIQSVFGGELAELTTVFFEKLAKGKRERHLGDVAKAFIHQVDASRGIYTVKVKTAAPLTEANRQKIQQLARGALSKGDAKEIRFEEAVDAALVGGFILTVDDRQVDTSFAHKLRELERSFNENIYIKNF